MRIRKRKVPFPISSLSPIPISDPLFTRPPPLVQLGLHLEDDADDYYDPRPSDQPTTNGQDSSAEGAVAAMFKGENKEEKTLWEEEGRGHDRGNWVGEKISINHNFTRKGSPSNAGAQVEINMILQQPAVSSSLEEKEVAEKCKEEVKTMVESTKMKRKVSNRKNAERHNGYVKEENDQSSASSIRSADHEMDAGAATCTASSNTSANAAAGGKKGRGRSGGAVLMEGSRCSRVNGRGWRCCQQTLVGYSLCEHHLGKGRLRSMNNVRNSRAKVNIGDDNAAPKKKKAVAQMPLLNYGQEVPKESSRSGDIEHGGWGEKVLARRKMKQGVVKARLISSLLGQQNEISDHDQL